MVDILASYDIKSSWELSSVQGVEISIGICNMLKAKARRYTMCADLIGGHSSSHLQLGMELIGIETNLSVSRDVLNAIKNIKFFVGSGRQRLFINRKNPTEMQSFDFRGPCSLISFNLAKVTGVTTIGTFAGGTYLFIGQGTTVLDQDPNWLQRVVDNTAGRSTLGQCSEQFYHISNLFANARAVCPFKPTEVSGVVKAECSLAHFSGQIEFASGSGYSY